VGVETAKGILNLKEISDTPGVECRTFAIHG